MNKYIACLTFLFFTIPISAAISADDFDIQARSYGIINSSLLFSVDPIDTSPTTSYFWDFDDGTTATGAEVIHSFDKVDRYRVKLTVVVAEQNAVERIQFVNIGRALADTKLSEAGTSFLPSKTESKSFSWINCSPNFNAYYGKYNTLWIDENLDATFDRQHIINALLLNDYLFEANVDIYGWDFIPSNEALNTYVCDDIQGAGTGTGGTFMNAGYFAHDATQAINANDYGPILHENIHLWDFRGQFWQNGPDTAHSFTGAMEPITNYLLGTGQTMTPWGGGPDLKSLPSDFIFNHYFRVLLNRYLSHPELNWFTYFNDEFLNTPYDDQDMPEHKEQMLVQAGILMSIFHMHGAAGLKQVFMAIDDQLQQTPELSNSELTQQQKADNFMKAVADGLQLDVSDYFVFWKYPVESLASYMSKYPKSTQIVDHDGDGFSPLQGDLNDDDITSYPYAQELMDGKDNNQDGLIDETVYTEADGDIDTQSITLPASIIASLDDLNDQDTYQFTLTKASEVTFALYAVESDYTVSYSDTSLRKMTLPSGLVYLDDNMFVEIIHEAMSAPENISAIKLAAGTHRFKLASVAHDGVNPNPGKYELQLFINDYQPKITQTSLMTKIYPLSVLPAVEASNITVSQQQEITLTAPVIAVSGELIYRWEQVAGTDVTLSNADQSAMTFKTPTIVQDETLSFNVVMANAKDEITVMANVNVLQNNQAPVVDISAENATVIEGLAIAIVATVSDEAVDQLTYQWSQLSGPNVIVDDDAASEISVIVPQVDSDQIIELQVNVSDGELSTTATLSLTIINQNTAEPSEPVEVTKSSGGFCAYLSILLLLRVIGRRAANR